MLSIAACNTSVSCIAVGRTLSATMQAWAYERHADTYNYIRVADQWSATTHDASTSLAVQY